MVCALHMYLPTLMVIGTHVPFNTPQQSCRSSLARVPCGPAREPKEKNCRVTGHALTIKCTPPASSQLTHFLEGSWGKSAASWDHVAWHPPCELAQILSSWASGQLEGCWRAGSVRSTLRNFLSVQWLGLCFHCQGLGSSPGQGTKTPQAVWYGQKPKTKQANKRAPCDYKTLGPAVSPMACSAYLYPASPTPGWSMTCPCPYFQESLWCQDPFFPTPPCHQTTPVFCIFPKVSASARPSHVISSVLYVHGQLI